jgi:hypothetical protein
MPCSCILSRTDGSYQRRREEENELVNRVYCLRMIELVDYQQAVNTSDRVSFAHAVLTNGKIL